MDADFAEGHRDGVVEDLTFFEIRVCAKEFDVLSAVLDAATVLEDFLQADTGPDCCSNGAFAPWCVDQLVTVARVLVDLLNAAGSGTLQCYSLGHAWENGFILELLERDFLGVVDKTFHLEEELVGIDLRDTSVVADKEILVRGDGGLLFYVSKNV